MSRMKHERAPERLRTAWTSTADLEETLASMFHPPQDSPDNLTASQPPVLPPDKLTVASPLPSPPDKLSSSKQAVPSKQTPPDKLTGGVTKRLTPTPQDNLSGAVYRTLDGRGIEARFVRPCRLVQDGHTPSEHLVYLAMYKLAGDQDQARDSREAIIPLQAVAAKTAISLRNVRRVIRALEEKLAIEVTEYEDKTRSIPRRYRVWGMNAILERRRGLGYEFVYRNRNLITLARAEGWQPPDKLTGDAPDSLSAAPPVNLTPGPPDSQVPDPPDSLSGNKVIDERKAEQSSPARLVDAVHRQFGFVDDDAIQRLVSASRRVAPDATEDEISWAIGITAGRIRAMRHLTNPVGMLITQVPKCFEGASFRLYRESVRQRREAERREAERWRREAEAILADPRSPEEDRDWARTVLEAD